MDADVDPGVGDSISYRTAANLPPLESSAGAGTIPAFLILRTPEQDLAGRPATWTLKVHKRFLAGPPEPRNRIDHAKLDGVTYRPATDTIDDDGDYYRMDLQKA